MKKLIVYCLATHFILSNHNLILLLDQKFVTGILYQARAQEGMGYRDSTPPWLDVLFSWVFFLSVEQNQKMSFKEKK